MESKHIYLKYDPLRSSVSEGYDTLSVDLVWNASYNASIHRNVIQYSINVNAYTSPGNAFLGIYSTSIHIPSIGVYADNYNVPDFSETVKLQSYGTTYSMTYNITHDIHERADISGVIDYANDEISIQLIDTFHTNNYITFTSGAVGTMSVGVPTHAMIIIDGDPGISHNLDYRNYVPYNSSVYFSLQSSGQYDYASIETHLSNGVYENGYIYVTDRDICVLMYGYFYLNMELSDGASISVADSDGGVYLNGDLIRYGKKVFITASPLRGYILSGMTINGTMFDYNTTTIIDSVSNGMNISLSATPRHTISIGHSGTFQKYAIFIYRNGSWGLYQPLIYKSDDWAEYE